MDRPDGRSLEQYKGNEKWSHKRWAWEFLRRNTEFLRQCKMLIEAPDLAPTEEEIAEQFGLKRFKSAKSPYGKKGEFERPRFVAGTVSSYSRLTEERGRLPRRLQQGEVAFILDLNSALSNAASLKKQISNVRKIAEKRLRTLAELRNVATVPQYRIHSEKLLPYLRILDARAAGMTRQAVFKLVLPEEAKVCARKASPWEDTYAPIEIRAKKYAESDYLKLVLAREK